MASYFLLALFLTTITNFPLALSSIPQDDVDVPSKGSSDIIKNLCENIKNVPISQTTNNADSEDTSPPVRSSNDANNGGNDDDNDDDSSFKFQLFCDCDVKHSSPWGLPIISIDCRGLNWNYGQFHAENLPYGSESLNMAWNKFDTIPIFNASKLQQLDLSFNQIKTLPANSFAKVATLRQLILNDNQIGSISDDAFAGLRQLRELNLARNLLTKLESNVLSTLPTLRSLVLSGNDLRESFDKETNLFLTYGATPKLLTLEMDHCNLTEIDLMHGIGLETLQLAFNQFTVAPDFPRGLISLDLSGNPVEVLDKKFLPHLSSLTKLYLKDMPLLTTIEENAFFALPNLTFLTLEGSHNLSEMSGKAFGKKVDNALLLKEVRLRGCNFKVLNATFQTVFANVEILELSGNPFICDCQAKWIQNFKLETNAECSKPASLQGHKITEVPSTRLECTRWASWIYRVMNGLLVLLLLVLCVLATWLIVMGLKKPSRRIVVQRLGGSSPYARVTIEPNRAEHF